jgi:hypothetical protein
MDLTFFTFAASVSEDMVPARDSDAPRKNASGGEPSGTPEASGRQLIVKVWRYPDGHLQFDSNLAPGEDPVLDVLTDGMREMALILERNVKAPDDAGRAEARSRIRLEALYRKLIRDSFSVKELGVFRLSRQRLQQLRKDDRLFAVQVPNQKGLLHPRWQFDDANRPRIEMPDLIAAARDGGLDAIGFHQLMVNPEATEDGALVDLLDLGRVQDVLEILRAGGG